MIRRPIARDSVVACEAREPEVERPDGLEAADRDCLVELWVRAWNHGWPAIDFEARRAWFADHLDALLRDGAALLLVRGPGGTPRGFLTVHPDTGVVDQLAVEPEAAGQEIGRALIAEAKRRGPGRLRLTVNQGNGRAVRFYARAGFVVTGEARNARSGLPVWLMAWPAPP